MEAEIQRIVDRETQAWNQKSVELLLSIFHPDMVWVWPRDPADHDVLSWECPMGKFHFDRWSEIYRDLFQTYELVHNFRETRKITVTPERDGAFAVVDIDTLWRSADQEMRWKGRTGKTYVRTPNGWKMIAQVGVLI